MCLLNKIKVTFCNNLSSKTKKPLVIKRNKIFKRAISKFFHHNPV